jgi:AraC family transcriptional regulator of arabinose operon
MDKFPFYLEYPAMRVKSISWGASSDPASSLTIGEFSQGPEYRTLRKDGTPNFLLILTLEGGGRVTGPGGQSYLTEPGDILLYEPGAFHHYGTSPETGRWTLAWSHFVPPAAWNYWPDWEYRWSGLRRFRIGPVTTGRVRDTLRMVHEADIGSGELAGRFMLNCLERAWIHIRLAQQRALKPDRDPRIQKALHFIEANLQGKLSITRIARQCGLSLSRFAHLFRAETGNSPQQFIEARRMELARNLLRYANLSVGEVAQACGYEDPFYFSSRFSLIVGTSPRAYQRQ